MAEKPSPRFNTLTDRARYYTGGLTRSLGQTLHEWGIHPDVITAAGLVIVAIAAYAASQGEFVWAAIIIILGAPLDALDGAVARAMQREGKFGALLDSTLDRYADGFIFIGIATYYSVWGEQNMALLAMLAMLGTQLVSYVRARAEGIGIDCKVGLLTRMERIGIILVMLLTGWIELGLWILVIGTHFTVAQRVWHVYRALNRKEG